MARYRATGALLLNSVDCGAWRWRSDRVAPPVAGCERSVRKRYWLPPPAPIGAATP